jgi:DNA-binding CsgD family transcriptional regulator
MFELDNKERLIVSATILMSIIFIVFDVTEDLQNGSSMAHVIKEIIIVCMGLLVLVTLWFKFFSSNKKNQRLIADIKILNSDLEKYKNETKALAQGLSLKIDAQLKSWGLTPAEQEVALLLLKGLSNAEIAQVRSSSESTVRGQVNALFKKSHMHGRSEFSAFFLEDILVMDRQE